MHCPKCSNENVQLAQAIYEGGTGTFTASSSHLGYAAGGFAGGATVTSGQTATLIASKMGSPSQPTMRLSIGILGLFICIGGLLFSTIVSTQSFKEPLSMGNISFAAFFAILSLMSIKSGFKQILSIKTRNLAWVESYQDWLEQWYCHRCGHIFNIQLDNRNDSMESRKIPLEKERRSFSRRLKIGFFVFMCLNFIVTTIGLYYEYSKAKSSASSQLSKPAQSKSKMKRASKRNE